MAEQMLEKALIEVLNMSLTASVVILAVFVLRLFLKKAPRIFSYALWAVVLFRLLCPVSFPAPLSLLGVLQNRAEEDVYKRQGKRQPGGRADKGDRCSGCWRGLQL